MQYPEEKVRKEILVELSAILYMLLKRLHGPVLAVLSIVVCFDTPIASLAIQISKHCLLLSMPLDEAHEKFYRAVDREA